MEKVYQPIDHGEDGRAHIPSQAVFINKADADEVSKAWNYNATSSRVLYVMSSIAEYEAWMIDEVRRKALAKLTDEERKALGLEA